MTSANPLLDRLERYYDAVPRARARIEEIGPFTLFVAGNGWPYYARPRLGETQTATADDVRAVLARQRELDVPQAMEWVDAVTPGLVDVVEAAGIQVHRCPLLVLDGQPQGSPGAARLIEPQDEDLVVATRAAISVGFDNGGTSTGEAGVEARDAAATKAGGLDDAVRNSLANRRLVMAAVFADEAGSGPVGGGSLMPVEGVGEIAGLAVLPAYRRRSLGAQLTHVLATEGYRLGLSTIFCGADSVDVASVYEGIGFRRVGTACIAQVD